MTKVLLVEDDSAIAGPLLRAFSREGYDVQAVETGQAALDAMESPTDLVVLDLGLPDMDGLDVARKARSDGKTIIDLTLSVKTKEQAEAICNNWRKQHEDVYMYLMDSLMN